MRDSTRQIAEGKLSRQRDTHAQRLRDGSDQYVKETTLPGSVAGVECESLRKKVKAESRKKLVVVDRRL